MSSSSILRRFLVRGVFWRKCLSWGVRNIPFHFKPIVMFSWSFLFYLLWFPGRRGVARNLGDILPGSSRLANLARAYLVFLNFAWTFMETASFNEQGSKVDWEFEGLEHLQRLSEGTEGAIVLTAHMGNYDLGSYLFAQKLKRVITTVRAPELDIESDQHSRAQRERVSERLRVNYNLDPGSVVFDLVEAIRRGEVVAIQGDRVMKGVSSVRTRLFNQPALLPTGPFALAMATRAAIYPLFVARVGWKRYRVITFPPFEVLRTGRDRDRDLGVALEHWRGLLEQVIAEHWNQWFSFERFATGENA